MAGPQLGSAFGLCSLTRLQARALAPKSTSSAHPLGARSNPYTNLPLPAAMTGGGHPESPAEQAPGGDSPARRASIMSSGPAPRLARVLK